MKIAVFESIHSFYYLSFVGYDVLGKEKGGVGKRFKQAESVEQSNQMECIDIHIQMQNCASS